MIRPRTLRGQLTLAYAVALLLALTAFAGLTLALVDSTQRATLDDRLQLGSRAISAIVDERDGKLLLDLRDRFQLSRVVGTRLDGAVVQRDGTVAYSTDVAVPREIRALGAMQQTTSLTVRSADTSLRVAVVPVPIGRHPLGIAVVWTDLDSVGELDHRLGLAFAFAIPLIALFAMLAGGAVAARGLRPLVAMAEVASEIEAHDLARRIAIPDRDDELGRLCVTFDRMLDRLQSAFDRERRFTSDASHELRAPLSVIRAEADLMLRRARTPEEYERALRSIAVQADDLEALTRDLLAAARGDAGLDGRATSVDLGAVAEFAAERLEPLAHTRGIALHRSIDADAEVRGNEPAMRRAVTCLLHNALKYARDGGTVTVRVTRDGPTVRLSVGDDGPGFTDEALVHATERFWRDDPARLRPGSAGDDASGSGLGLSIASAIVRAAHGSLRLTNRPEGGALVVIELPASPGKPVSP